MPSPTAVLLLNLGGPADLDAVEPFLRELFLDPELMPLPFREQVAPWLARQRSRRVRPQYAAIGGGSPILSHVTAQGAGLCSRLDATSPESAPHRFYVAFRYAPPTTEGALRAMASDGIRRVVILTLYPQWSCTTTGSSLNELWRVADRVGLRSRFDWTLIDRWPTHPAYILALAETVLEGLARFPAGRRNDALVLFSAHSLPLSVIDRGDAYPHEVAATTHAVMQALGESHRHMLTWQSSIGPIRWLGPQTASVLQQLGARRERDVLVVPIAFTSDHIETLYELDRENRLLAVEAGIEQYERAPALNARPAFLDALAAIVREHLQDGGRCSTRYLLRCAGCVNFACRHLPRRLVEEPPVGFPPATR